MPEDLVIELSEAAPEKYQLDKFTGSWSNKPGSGGVGRVFSKNPVVPGKQVIRLAHGDADDALAVSTGVAPPHQRFFTDDKTGARLFWKEILWQVLHGADNPNKPPDVLERAPDYNAEWILWNQYAQFNEAAANALNELAPPGATVIVHDYQFMLVPRLLRSQFGRGDLKIGFYVHTAWASAGDMERVFGSSWARDLLRGIHDADAVGLQTPVWERHFNECTEKFLHPSDRRADTFVAPVTIDFAEVRRTVNNHSEAQAGASRIQRIKANLEEGGVVATSNGRLVESKNPRGLMRAVSHLLWNEKSYLQRAAHRYPGLLDRFSGPDGEPTLLGKFVLFMRYYDSSAGPVTNRYTEDVLVTLSAINNKWQSEYRELTDDPLAQWRPIHMDRNNSYEAALGEASASDIQIYVSERGGLDVVALEADEIRRDNSVLILSKDMGASHLLVPQGRTDESYVVVDPRRETSIAEGIVTGLGKILELERNPQYRRMIRARESSNMSRSREAWLKRIVDQTEHFHHVHNPIPPLRAIPQQTPDHDRGADSSEQRDVGGNPGIGGDFGL